MRVVPTSAHKRWGLRILAWTGAGGWIGACGGPPGPSVEVERGERVGGAVDGELGFADGLRLVQRAVSPTRVAPGGTLELTWRAEGRVQGALRLTLMPPRAAARQEVRYGHRPPAMPDPRIQWVEANVNDGHATLGLPVPWHPRTAVVWVQPSEGAAAVTGPRTGDGQGVFGLVEVVTRPTALTAGPAAGVTVDGSLDEPCWQTSPQSLVTSIDGEPHPGPGTRVWMAWDSDHLFVAGQLPDPDVWGTHTQRDEPLWEQEVFEVFLAADGSARRYLELQVSPRNVVFDARFERYRQGDPAWNSRMHTGVVVTGDVDNRKDRDDGWTVEMAIPWSDICDNTGVTCPPRAGLTLRMNVFRFERPAKGPPVALALSPTRKPDFHAWQNAAKVVLAP